MQPGPQGLQKAADRGQIRRDLAPEGGQRLRHLDNTIHAKGAPGIGHLALGDPVVHDEKQRGHGKLKASFLPLGFCDLQDPVFLASDVLDLDMRLRWTFFFILHLPQEGFRKQALIL